jgi:carbon storage regulator
MLVITRRKNETVHIGDDVHITIVRTSGDKVRLGIQAPAGVQIIRDDANNTDPKEPEPSDQTRS